MAIHEKEEHIPIGDVGRWLHSPVPNLDFPADVMGLGIYDPVADVWLQTPAESALAQAELASTRAENAEAAASASARAEDAEARAENAEAEVARLQEELACLQARSN